MLQFPTNITIIRAKLNNLLFWIIGSKSDNNSTKRLFITTNFIGSIICLVGSTINFSLHYPIITTLVPLCILCFTSYCYFKGRNSDKYNHLILPLIISCYIGLSIIWFYNGGFNGNNNLMFLVLLILSLRISKDQYKFYNFLFFLLVVLSINTWQYYNPNTVTAIPTDKDKFIDLIFSMLNSSLAIYLLITFLQKDYLLEKSKVVAKEIELNDKNIKLERLNSNKDKYFSIIAHDLRNPIYNYEQMLDLIRNHELDEDEKKEIFDLLHDSAKNLSNLLENLLTWTKSQQGEIRCNLTYNYIHLLVKLCIDHLSLQAKTKEITLINNINPNIIAFFDRNLTTTIIRNLISNAIKYSYQKSNIMISSEFVENWIYIKVSDTGTGMSEMRKNQLFNKIGTSFSFDGTLKEKGTGIGLLLCKEFAELQGGKIWFESTEGVGTTFYLSLHHEDDENIVAS